ncbi:hypothetical protein [Flagellimonas crocea]|uniref:hypothetical protein n=1 Tax=Flagellimonas crocea TaxID=3067311 RepID=UPI00296E6193|nr:hypothetical protein [Muricauda sp. DH64]
MRLQILFAVLFTVGWSSLTSAQEEQNSFYENLAIKDAQYEQYFVFMNAEDEKDFWKDQKRYENDLRKQNSEWYHSYLNGKRIAYSQHAKACSSHCTHSELFFEEAKRYFIYYDNKTFLGDPADIIVQIDSPRIF